MSDQVTAVPVVLLAGGRPRDPAYMVRLLRRALGDASKPSVAYIGTANGDSTEFFLRMEATLREAGAGQVIQVRLAREDADIRAARAILEAADVVFLSGGEVEDGIYWIVKHGLDGFLRDLHRSGVRFIGVSAGVIMMGTHWVHWDIPEDDSTASLFDCLGLTPLLFDTHGEDEDWVELKAALVLLGEGAVGYGLPGGTMVSADSRGTLVSMEKDYLVFRHDDGKITCG